MGALGNIVRGTSEQQEKPVQVDIEHDNRGINPGEKEIHGQNSNDVEVNDERVTISMSKRAYEALEKFTKELNERESSNSKSFTIEEVLDEEMMLLFSDE